MPSFRFGVGWLVQRPEQVLRRDPGAAASPVGRCCGAGSGGSGVGAALAGIAVHVAPSVDCSTLTVNVGLVPATAVTWTRTRMSATPGPASIRGLATVAVRVPVRTASPVTLRIDMG
jgi:hypothetical protein